jgi:ribosomal-protein-alanine N-acetyltransferase
MVTPLKELTTERLVLRAPRPDVATELADFHERNRAHLEPWSPPRPPELFTEPGQRKRMELAAAAFERGEAWRWNITKPGSNLILGYVNFSQVHRGAFHSCMLGYALDEASQGKGYMFEALTAAIGEVFSERGRLHRIQANVIPENTRSLALLKKLKFLVEGRSQNYLFIGGAWQDHVLTALLNPEFREEWLVLSPVRPKE